MSKKIRLVKKSENQCEQAAVAVTPVIDVASRCIAICADNTQCTRVKKRGCLLCGTHAKNGSTAPKIATIDVWVEEINGIAYYLDKNGNVYDTEGVLENRRNPAIVGHYSGVSPNITIDFRNFTEIEDHSEIEI